jgi:hypothetical protein
MSHIRLLKILTAKGLVVYLIFLFVVSCTETEDKLDPCAMAVDTISIFDKKMLNSVTYYLVLRVSGWHDKSEILELYDAEPVFDHCAKSKIEPIYGDSLELTQTVSHVYLDVNSKSLKLEYIQGKPGRLHNNTLKLELKNTNEDNDNVHSPDSSK